MSDKLIEVTPGGELTETLDVDPNRVVVYGSRTSGAFDLADELDAYMKEQGIHKPNVDVLRDAAYLDQAFFNIPLPGFSIDRTALPSDSSQPRPPKTLPRGVLILPEMRQYYDGRGMTLDTYNSKDLDGKSIFDHIKRLCDENGVPYLCMQDGSTRDQLLAGLKSLDAPKTLEKSTE